MNDQIEKAVKILNDGGIIIFPTDTAFGIGCRIDREDSIQHLFQLRRRPNEQATPVLVSSVEMVKDYVREIPNDVQTKLIDKYWPGALTIVLPCKTNKVPSLVRGGGNSLGVRMPNNNMILEIIKKVGVPILGPSANYHNEQTPYPIQDLNKELVRKSDFVVDGKVNLYRASTVIDCANFPWKILRQGAININI